MQEFFSVRAITLTEAIIILLIGLLLGTFLGKRIRKVLGKTKLDPLLHRFIANAAKFAVWVIAITAALGQLGISSGSIITVLAACGAAIALALQNSLSDLASGVLIMASHPFRSGDYVVSSGVEGTVDSIDLFHTVLMTADGKTVTVPNSTLVSGTLTNLTSGGMRRVDINVGISYDSDPAAACQALLDMAAAQPTTLTDPAPACDVSGYGDSAIQLFLRFWVRAEDYWTGYFGAYNGIKDAFDKAGVAMPFPQLDVHLDR